jgi:hypothetical protein
MPDEQKQVQREQTQPEQEQSEPSGVKESETAAAKSRAAVFVDAFLVEAGDQERLFRITLGEGNAGMRERIRFAFMMPTDDVRELVKILTRLLSKVDAEKTGDKA